MLYENTRVRENQCSKYWKIFLWFLDFPTLVPWECAVQCIVQCIVQWMGFLIFPFHIFNHYCEKPTTINILKYKKQKLLIPKFWSAEPKRGNYRWDKHLEKSLSYGAKNLCVYFYYWYMLVVVESSQLDLAVLNYKNFILKNIVLHCKPQNFFQNSSISPILIKIFEKFYGSNWLIYK